MIELMGWATAVLVLVLVFRQRPAVWVSAGILCAVFLPVVATRSWLLGAGNLGRIHPSAWIFLTGLLVTALFSPAKVTVPKVRTAVVLGVGLWVAVTVVVVVHRSGLHSVGAAVVYYLTPPLAFLAIHVAVSRADADLWKKVVPVVLVAASLESVLALLQFFTHTSLVFTDYYATNYWWESHLERALGTFDNPLDLAAFLTMCIPLTATRRRTSVVLLLAGLLALGVVVSGSRTGVLLAAIAIVWIVFVRSSNAVPAILTTATLALATVFLLSSPLATTLLDRFGAGGDLSTQARADALTAGLGLATDSIGGHGLGYAYAYSSAALASSFEDAYLATAIDLGPLVAVGLVVVQLWAVLSGARTPLLLRAPGVIALVWGFSYSSFVSTSTFGTLSWTFVALAAVAGYRSSPLPGRAPRPRPAVAGPAASPRTVLGRA